MTGYLYDISYIVPKGLLHTGNIREDIIQGGYVSNHRLLIRLWHINIYK